MAEAFVKPLMKMMEKGTLLLLLMVAGRSMEVAGALSIFQRSQSLYNVRYTKYLGDGDSKAFTSIVENKVYGDHCSVEKLEYAGDTSSNGKPL
ncbi:hypothetical protein TNCV_358101 [Trichonephila clavipes]|nr:hypothetical protein TNCV_358101 [Trichonephila clavipes]